MNWSDLKWISDVGHAVSGCGVTKSPTKLPNGDIEYLTGTSGPNTTFGIDNKGPYVHAIINSAERMTPDEARELAGYLIRSANEADMLRRSVEMGLTKLPPKEKKRK